MRCGHLTLIYQAILPIMTSKIIGIAVFAAAALLPSFAFAQTATTTGLLNVYAQVLNQSGFTYTPGNFTIAVSGTNPSPSSFPGSISGTLVSLNAGAYSVTVTNQLNYTPAYSVGCTGTISPGTTQTCVITLTPGTVYSNPTVYPYPGTFQPLTCRTDTPVVGLGQTARFTAVGGVGGTYNWMTASQNFPNIGPVLSTTFMSSGSHSVTVTNASQTATCPITVTTSYVAQPQNPGGVSPYYPTPGYPSYGTPSYPTYPQQPVLTSQIYPRFPNTGLEPLTSAQIAFALVALMGAAIAAFPYARKTFAFAVR